LPAIVARRQQHAAEPLDRGLAGLGSCVQSSRNAASMVSSTMPLTTTPAIANARITVLASWTTLATSGSPSTAYSGASSAALGGAGAPM
jgi:hypothetical protein